MLAIHLTASEGVLDIVQISADDGDDAVQLAQFLRLAIVWGILMIGSMLAVVAAAIQLART